MKTSVTGVCFADPSLPSEAEAIAGRLGLPVIAPGPELMLSVRPDGLFITRGGSAFSVDFSSYLRRAAGNNIGGELIVRAAKPDTSASGRIAVDCTAGFGEDSFILAAAGYTVIMFEHNEVTAELLSDGLRRGRSDPATREICSRMELRRADSAAELARLGFIPDVVYLDPMFPQRKKSGAVKKKARFLGELDGPCADGDALLGAALATGARRIIVKRPRGGEYLAGRKPDYSLAGDTVRYDCFTGRTE